MRTRLTRFCSFLHLQSPRGPKERPCRIACTRPSHNTLHTCCILEFIIRIREYGYITYPDRAVISLVVGSMCVAIAFLIATGKHIGDCDLMPLTSAWYGGCLIGTESLEDQLERADAGSWQIADRYATAS